MIIFLFALRQEKGVGKDLIAGATVAITDIQIDNENFKKTNFLIVFNPQKVKWSST